jgi:hypothetical protein
MRFKLLRRLAAPACVALVMLQGCAPEERDVLSSETMHGTWKGANWTAGPGAVVRDAQSTIIVRVFEQGSKGDPCKLPIATGRRLEVILARMELGSFDANQDPGYRVEMWDGLTGQSDPQAMIEVDQVSKKAGGSVVGRARFGSMLTGDIIEGQFTATLCEDLP